MEKARVEKAAKCLHWDGVRLYLSTHGVLRRFPALVERRDLVYDAALRLGVPGGRRLRRLLTQRYHWPGLARDVLRWCQEFIPVQLGLRGRLDPPKYLLPTPYKCTSPFHTWAVDLIVLPGPHGIRYILVCVCVFSKWVEAGVLLDKEATTVTRWFHGNITCRFGSPAYVRADRGGEFRGAFARYLERLGTRLLLTLPNNPRANGLVERINGLIANGLRKMLLALPGVALEDALVDVLAGLRQLPTRLGWQPFLLVFK